MKKFLLPLLFIVHGSVHAMPATSLVPLGAAHGVVDFNDALYEAVQRGHCEYIRHLLSLTDDEGNRRVDIETRLEYGMTPLHWAVANGYRAVIELLLSWGADVNAKQIEQKTSLHIAALRGDVEAMELLFTYHAAINEQDQDGMTPLHLAVMSDWVGAVKRLIAHGAAVAICDEDGKTPLERATDRGNPFIMDCLQKASQGLRCVIVSDAAVDAGEVTVVVDTPECDSADEL